MGATPPGRENVVAFYALLLPVPVKEIDAVWLDFGPFMTPKPACQALPPYFFAFSRSVTDRFLPYVGCQVRLIDCNNWNDLLLCLMSNRGATIVAENTLSDYDDMDVSIYRLPNMNLENSIYACWPLKQSESADKIPALIDMLQAEFLGFVKP